MSSVETHADARCGGREFIFELMLFTKRKLPLEKAADLYSYPLDERQDFRILGSPVYLLMPRNGKLVSVKEPLDFFTPEERIRLSQTGSQYFVTRTYQRANEFFEHGRALRRTLSWLKESDGVKLEPAPYEVSQALRERLNGVWSQFVRGSETIAGIESFFVAFLVDGLCDPMPIERRIAARTDDFERYERALLQSSLAVFFLLHLSYLEPRELGAFRTAIFEAEYAETAIAIGTWPREVAEIRAWISRKFPDGESRLLTAPDVEMAGSVQTTLRKVFSRMRRFQSARLNVPTSVRGRNGFVDAENLLGVTESDVTATLSCEFLEVKDAS